MLYWNIYELSSEKENLLGVKLRGRIRKYSLEQNIILLVENAVDLENTVRFALLSDEKTENFLLISSFITSLISDISVKKVLEDTPNPILSKLKNNNLFRY